MVVTVNALVCLHVGVGRCPNTVRAYERPPSHPLIPYTAAVDYPITPTPQPPSWLPPLLQNNTAGHAAAHRTHILVGLPIDGPINAIFAKLGDELQGSKCPTILLVTRQCHQIFMLMTGWIHSMFSTARITLIASRTVALCALSQYWE